MIEVNGEENFNKESHADGLLNKIRVEHLH